MTASIVSFMRGCLREIFRWNPRYYALAAFLVVGVAVGGAAYMQQARHGLIVTGLSDQVSWGVYIANFTFLVGLGSACMLLVLPSYVLRDEHASKVTPLSLAVAVAACVAALLFVLVDLGRPDRMFNMLPFGGHFNWPGSMLAWDVVMIPGALALSLGITTYMLFQRYRGQPPGPLLAPVGVLVVVWAIALHEVTAFLYMANVARPFWHSPLLGPRFLASAFASGPALLLAVFRVVDTFTRLEIPKSVRRLLANVTAAALLVNLMMLGAEVFTEHYRQTASSASAHYLFFGLGEANALVPWIRTAIAMEAVAAILLVFERPRRSTTLVLFACALTVVGVWIEKGMGLVVPGFVPTPLGEVMEYAPTAIETLVSIGIWCFGALVFIILARPAIAVNEGSLREST
ncbi:MAG: polysulfide reductase NrfD [Myxococcales bacterium]|jgi:molybdopterin-containing oxidoreductase family membrane subunit